MFRGETLPFEIIPNTAPLRLSRKGRVRWGLELRDLGTFAQAEDLTEVAMEVRPWGRPPFSLFSHSARGSPTTDDFACALRLGGDVLPGLFWTSHVAPVEPFEGAWDFLFFLPQMCLWTTPHYL